MTHKKFTVSWKRSTQPRKQRKYRVNAPLHHKQKMMHAHLAPLLRKKYGIRSAQVRKGDTVKIMRGQFRKKEGKVELVLLKRERIQVTGAEVIKRDGGKAFVPLNPSNVMIIELDLTDKLRRQKLESTPTRAGAGKSSAGNMEKKAEKKEIKGNK